jgi:erythromycin esterase
MKNKAAKKCSPILRVVLVLLAAAVTAGLIFSCFGGFGTGPCADTEEFAKYAGTVPDITIPGDARIIALGEATHGNAEFQQLKLDVFRVMVERYGVRAFALEGDYGGCEAVNRYIHGGDGTAEEAAAAIGFAIYRTQQMADLIRWMRTYNDSAAEGEDLRFYGFDMQRIAYNYKYLLEAAQHFGIDTADLKKLWDEGTNSFSDAYNTDQRKAVFEAIRQELVLSDDPQADGAAHFADILLQNAELGKFINDPALGNITRDRMMAENTLWILAQEEARNISRIFITGHNAHLQQFGSYSADGKFLGNLLADELGDGYYVIGTDFYKSSCNLPAGNDGKRSSHTFYSYDPLAKASKKCGYEVSWLDFSKIPDDSPLKQQTLDYTWMGSVDERYSPLMTVLPMTYRVWRSPASIFDAMIFVADAHPTMIR